MAKKNFQKLLWTMLLCLLAPHVSFAGFFVQNGQLLDANGTPFVMRGINYPFAWYTHRYPSQTQQDFANMAATGANTVRIVLASGGQWTRVNGSQVADLIKWCKDNKLIAVLEVHDATGWNEATSAVHISHAVSYWTSSDIRAAINGQEDFLIINIANEPFGNTTTSYYVNDTIAAIRALRNAGLTHNLMVDAANWGQDWSNTMRNNALQIFDADPLRNITFSVHMYEVYQSLSAVSSYMQGFDDVALPLVVGEFGADHSGQNVDEGSIMSESQRRGNGYIGWSWSGNGSCCTSLDIVSNFSTTLTTWGNILVNGQNGIKATSIRASVFGTSSSLTVSPTSVSLGASASSASIAVTANVSWSVTDDASWLSVAPTSGTNNGSFTISATGNTLSTSRSATVTVSGGGLTRTISVTQSGATSGASNVALNKPAQVSSTDGYAGGGSAAVDGNTGTRWSSAWSDPQWISVDLGSAHTINRVVLNWEAAYGRAYQIQVSNDGSTWSTIFSESNGNGGIDDLAVSGTGRYVRMYGTARATSWGYSLWEFEIYGSPASSTQLTVTPTSLSFTSAAGSNTITVSSNTSWTVTDNQSWLTISPTSGSNNGNVTLSVTANTATTSRTGTVTVTGGGLTRTVSVTQAGATSGATNVALNKPTQVSSTDGYAGNGSAAVDGNTGTRWASAWSDPQWISVDLGSVHTINRVVLNWETAYGRAYQIQVSSNGSTWSTIYSETNGNGGIDDLAISGTGRYVRMYGTARATSWGYSLWEFAVYGAPR